MTHYHTVIEEMVSQRELVSLAGTNGRCITATVSIPTPSQIRPRVNHMVREVEKRLKATEIDVRTAKMLLEPFHELESTIETDGDWVVTLAVYRAADIFRCFLVTDLTKDEIQVSDRFEVRPLLEAVSREQRFYILALSQKHVRLFDCTMHRIDEVDLKGRVQQNLHVFLSTKMPDHVLDGRAAGGPAVGSMKGVVFGTSADREKHDEYLAHFFRAIDSGLHPVLASTNTPLLLAGVEEEVALYRKINTHKQIIEQAVYGSQDGVNLRQLQQRAREVMRSRLAAPAAKVVAEFESHRGAKRVVTELDEILSQAEEGRVSDLLIREDAERLGDRGEGEDLLNLAAVRTLTHGGQAFTLRAAEMPEPADAAAVLRY